MIISIDAEKHLKNSMLSYGKNKIQQPGTRRKLPGSNNVICENTQLYHTQ